MSSLLEILLFVVLAWMVLKSGKKKPKAAPKHYPVKDQTAPRNTAQPKAAPKPSPVQSTEPDPDLSNSNAYYGEGEDPQEHESHLMHAAQEGETDEEHSAHLLRYALEDKAEETKAVRENASVARPGTQNSKAALCAALLKSDTNSLRRAFVLSEVLGKPAAMRGRSFPADHR